MSCSQRMAPRPSPLALSPTDGSSRSTAPFAPPCETGLGEALAEAAVAGCRGWALSLGAGEQGLTIPITPSHSYPWAGGKGMSAIAFVDTALVPDMSATVASNTALLKGLGFPLQRCAARALVRRAQVSTWPAASRSATHSMCPVVSCASAGWWTPARGGPCTPTVRWRDGIC